jgi:cardiolipin synthase (CMP-forming)
MIFNLPNNLTILRIALIPLIAILMFIPTMWAAWGALALYTMACVTDWLDGYLARKMQIISAFGRFLDPIADKLLIAVLLLIFAALDRLDGWWILPACVIMFREVLIAGLREFLSPQNIVIHVSKLAKWKTASQMVAMGFLVVGDFGNVILPETLLVGQVLLSMSAILTAITGWDYFKQGMVAIMALEKEGKN